MRIPAREARSLIVLTIAAASLGCIASEYAEDTAASVTSDGGNHVIVDINLHDDADNSDSGSKENSSSTDKKDSEAAHKAEGTKEDESKGRHEKTWRDIPTSSYVLIFISAASLGAMGVLAGCYSFNSAAPVLLGFGFFGITAVALFLACYLTL